MRVMQESPDRALARRLEAADAQAGLWCHEALTHLRPGVGSAAERAAGGVISYGGPGSWMTRGRGLGMEGPVSAEEVDRMETFFRSRGLSDWWVGLSPYTDPSLLEHLGRRGYFLADFDTVHVRSLSGAGPGAEPPQPPPEGVRVVPVARADARAWARLVAQAFSGQEEVTDNAVDMGLLVFHHPGGAAFWAYVDGHPAGGGAMALEDGLACLFGMATLPRYRRRGVQRALLDARVAYAAAEGCDLASVVTEPGSGSQRNAERAGFRVAYTRVRLMKRAG